ncbi:terpene cyclase/mutase family protein [Kitasatospora atroaurantiaca]|uniref:Squalene-hopene cyclase-like protein n=1 Tax=Kitasatospora atroaurantiaca TaxID=285545 RepID=A0A561EMI3_9ACTN|nr:prenyltransferase/squalene oxidase repeat-containing protein [Kitasatospora atroaurantiaca]TWE16824.1 squalene-hopene cyclase-like protein [Kitasatospora atroaurantiaca]
MLTAARLGATALAGLLLAGTAAAPALADTPSPSAPAAPAGIYGKGDPTYDGVWRQSLALTALAGAKVVPAESTVSWLAGQQCADGGWPSFRADTAAACDAKTEDSNATAVAVQALSTLGGHQDAVAKGLQWIKANQNADGSWAYNPGNPGDADSTGLTVSALLATGTDPAGVARSGKSAYDGLAGFQLGCASPADQRGAFAYQPAPDGALAANALAASQATLGAAGGKLPVTNTNRVDAAPKPLTCAAGATEKTVPRAESAEAASAYLVAQLNANGQHLMQTMPGATPTPDFAATSWAVLSLIQAGHPHQAASAADWLAGNGYAWAAKGKSGTDASAAATLLLVAQAAKLDPYNFGGTNLVQLLIDAGPAPKSVPSAAASAASANPDGTKAPGSGITEADDNGGFSPIWLVGIGLLVGIGGGLLISLNRKRGAHQQAAGKPATSSTEDKPEGDEQK